MFCDNMSSVNLINKGLSRDDFHQSCLREIYFTAAVNNFAIKAQHTRGGGGGGQLVGQYFFQVAFACKLRASI